MIEILEFIFQDFVHFAGTIVLICAIGEVVGEIAKVVKK